MANLKTEINIIYEAKDWIAIDKPAGMLVHPTDWAPRDEKTCLHLLRDKLGQKAFPVHRLDRATSGILLFALSSAAAARLGHLFSEQKVKKKYICLARGHVEIEGCLASPLKNEELLPQEAATFYRPVKKFEMNMALGPHPTVRYTLVEAEPKTGRTHQIRKHMKHLRHPIIGDSNYGDLRHNRLIANLTGFKTLFLRATELSIEDELVLAPDLKEWQDAMAVLDSQNICVR